MSKTIVAALAIVVIILGGLNVLQYYQFTQLREDHSSLEASYDELLDDYDSLDETYGELLDKYDSLVESYPISIAELKSPEGTKFIGKNVTVEGFFFYVANKTPILVSSPDYLEINTPIPEDRLLDLTGDIPENLTNNAGAMVHIKGTALYMSEISLRYILHRVIQLPLSPRIERLIDIVITGPVIDVPTKYAVLISGGKRPAIAHLRYWNDMKYMYSILVNRYNYRLDHIYVIYKDGVGEDTDMPVNYSATIANVTAVFDDLETKMTSNDQLFIYTNNHGGGFNPERARVSGLVDLDGDEPEAGYAEATYGDLNRDGDTDDTVKIDEVLCLYYYEVLSDDTLARMLDDLNYEKVMIFMEQCFSGGFIHDLSGPNRTILTACTEEQSSYSADTEGEYNEFSYHFMRAVDFVDEDGDGYGDADVNYSWMISMVEAFNYASQQDSRDESPHYDDNGDRVGHIEPIPNGGDGAVGNNAFL